MDLPLALGFRTGQVEQLKCRLLAVACFSEPLEISDLCTGPRG